LKKVSITIANWLDRLYWLWLALAAPFMLFPTPKRSLAMLVVPALVLLIMESFYWCRSGANGLKRVENMDRKDEINPYM